MPLLGSTISKKCPQLNWLVAQLISKVKLCGKLWVTWETMALADTLCETCFNGIPNHLTWKLSKWRHYRSQKRLYNQHILTTYTNFFTTSSNQQGDRKVRVFVEKTFRGRTYPKLVEICSSSYKTDYHLVAKDQESTVCKNIDSKDERILPRTIELPPLLREFIARETGNQNPETNVKIKANREKIARVAKEGETPNLMVTMGLGKPCSPRLYKGLNI